MERRRQRRSQPADNSSQQLRLLSVGGVISRRFFAYYLIAGTIASSVSTVASAQDYALMSLPFSVRSTDGMNWKGQAATIDIRPQLPDGTPAVVEIAFTVTAPTGRIFAVHAEIDPERLLDRSPAEWAVSLDYVPSTKPGYGVLSYASSPNASSRTATKGTLKGQHKGKIIEGVFTSNANGLQSGTFKGPYRVRCWAQNPASADAANMPGGRMSGGYVTVEDSNFATPFCSRFAQL